MLYTVDLRLNGEHYKKLALSQSLPLTEILKDEIFPSDIIAYQADWDYIRSDEIIKSDKSINCISQDSTLGHLIYQDTLVFILMMAFHNLYSNDMELVVEHSVGDGVFCELVNTRMLTAEDVEKLKQEVNSIISRKLPIVRNTITPYHANELFHNFKRKDTLKFVGEQNVVISECGNFSDYYQRPLAENTQMIKSFDIIYHSPGLILRYPRPGENKISGEFKLPQKLFSTHQEHDKWLNILKIHNISALNRAIRNYQITELIQIEEALHENKIVDIANKISWNDKVKIILVAGPSSSGKTTFAKRLSIQLRVNGIIPHIVGMDDYFLSRSSTPKNREGEMDFESLEALDTKLLNDHLQRLLKGEEVELPKYNFIIGKNEKSDKILQLKEKDVIILEGIHGLNDELTSAIPYYQKVKIYVSALNSLNIDAHNRIRTSDSRKIRRIIRDYKYRGHTAETTLMIWEKVREGEEKYIFPFQENADYMFNSILTYELAVLKKYLEPLLKTISRYSPVYFDAVNLLNLFDHVYNIPDDNVPSNSILREFMGGSIFKY